MPPPREPKQPPKKTQTTPNNPRQPKKNIKKSTRNLTKGAPQRALAKATRLLPRQSRAELSDDWSSFAEKMFLLGRAEPILRDCRSAFYVLRPY